MVNARPYYQLSKRNSLTNNGDVTLVATTFETLWAQGKKLSLFTVCRKLSLLGKDRRYSASLIMIY